MPMFRSLPDSSRVAVCSKQQFDAALRGIAVYYYAFSLSLNRLAVRKCSLLGTPLSEGTDNRHASSYFTVSQIRNKCKVSVQIFTS